MEKDWRMLCWNVNGIRAVHKKGFLEWLHKEDPDVMCLQETKAHPSQLPAELQKIEGYHTYFRAATKPGYSGVGLFSKEEPLQVSYGMNIEQFDNEGRMIVAEYPNFYLIPTYFPNGGASVERLNYKMAFYAAYLEFVKSLAPKPVIICGDVNTAHHEIDLALPKQNERNSGFMAIERAWLDQMTEAGFVDTFRLFNQEGGNYTWWDMRTRARERNLGWRIDYFLVSQELQPKVKSSGILGEVTGSDHCPISLEIRV